MKQLQSYTYTIPANGSVQIPAPNDNFYITAATGPVTVRADTFGKFVGLVAGQGLKGVPFSRLELFDETGAPNTVTILLTPVEFVNQVFSGSVGVVGAVALDAAAMAALAALQSVDLNTATLNTLTRPILASGSWVNVATMTAGQVLTVFNAAGNVNGAIIHELEAVDSSATQVQQSYIAKATAPANIADGAILASTGVTAANAGSVWVGVKRHSPILIPGGIGLYFISAQAGGVFGFRNLRYTML